MAIVCSGSVAVDHIMVFRGRFKDVILPDKIHVLNVAFHVPELRRSFGGTAANIAFNLRLLGEAPLILATVGADFDTYAQWLDRHGVRRDLVRELPGEVTAGAYITTDLDDNQIIGFHPGAMDRAHEVRVDEVTEPVEMAIVSPNGKRAMLEHARALKAAGVPTVVDPGQGLFQLSGEELAEMLSGADTYVVNDYEWALTLEKTGLPEAEIRRRVGTLIVTLGERGSRLWIGERCVEVPAVPAAQVVDPTGCGDAFRAGYLFGRRRGLAPQTCARVGNLMGSLLVEREGTQSLTLAPGELAARYVRAFGEAL